MKNQTREQRLEALIEVKNERIEDTLRILEGAFMVINSARLYSDLDDNSTETSEGLLSVAECIVHLRNALTVDRYWNLQKKEK